MYYNQQTTGDKHSDVILGLTIFLTSFSKPDLICSLKPPYNRLFYRKLLHIFRDRASVIVLCRDNISNILIDRTIRYLLSYPGPNIMGVKPGKVLSERACAACIQKLPQCLYVYYIQNDRTLPRHFLAVFGICGQVRLKTAYLVQSYLEPEC